MEGASILYWGDAAAQPKLWRRTRDYTHVRLHHFCRPPTFDSYKEYGLRLFTHEELAAQFHDLFPDFAEDVRQKAVTADLSGRLPPRIDAVLDDRYMIEKKNHYAVYGSEMILGLTNYLPAGPDYRQRLIDRGKPTMIAFAAPVGELEPSAVEELDMYLELLAEGAFENFEGPHHYLDFTASFHKTVPAEWISEYRWLEPAEFVRDRT